MTGGRWEISGADEIREEFARAKAPCARPETENPRSGATESRCARVDRLGTNRQMVQKYHRARRSGERAWVWHDALTAQRVADALESDERAVQRCYGEDET